MSGESRLYWSAIVENLYWVIQSVSVWCIRMMKNNSGFTSFVKAIDWHEKIGFEQDFLKRLSWHMARLGRLCRTENQACVV